MQTIFDAQELIVLYTIIMTNVLHIHICTCTNTVTAGFDPPLVHTDTRSSSHMGPVVYTTPQLLLHPTTLQAAILMLYSVSGWSPVNV